MKTNRAIEFGSLITAILLCGHTVFCLFDTASEVVYADSPRLYFELEQPPDDRLEFACVRQFQFRLWLSHEIDGFCGIVFGISVVNEKGEPLADTAPEVVIVFSYRTELKGTQEPETTRGGVAGIINCVDPPFLPPSDRTSIGEVGLFFPHDFDGKFKLLHDNPVVFQGGSVEPLLVFHGKGVSEFVREDSSVYRVSCETFIRGDTNDDAVVDISDVVLLLDWMFRGSGDIRCVSSADGNDDGAMDVSDAIYILEFLFQGSQLAPPVPFPEAGVDPTADRLPCEGVHPIG